MAAGTVAVGHRTRVLTWREKEELGRVMWSQYNMRLTDNGYETMGLERSDEPSIIGNAERRTIRAAFDDLPMEERDHWVEAAVVVAAMAIGLMAFDPNLAIEDAIKRETQAP